MTHSEIGLVIPALVNLGVFLLFYLIEFFSMHMQSFFEKVYEASSKF